MQEQLLSKFNLYDHIGYLMVGSVAVIVLAFDLLLLKFAQLLPPFRGELTILWFILAYFVGHLTQAIANIVVKENKTEFSDHDKGVLSKAKKYFEIRKASDNEIYNLCYMLTCAKDITGQVQSFNAYYSLYRGWFVIFALESSYLLIAILGNWQNYLIVISFIISTFFMLLFRNRFQRFYGYSRTKTLQTFILISQIKKGAI